MRNPRSNFIPLPTKPAKSTPKPLPKVLGTKKSSSSQTERVVLIKEENLCFYPCSRLSHNDGGMRRDYVKAVNYINSCHKFINTIIEKNSMDKSNLFLLPMVTNFIPLFPHLVGKKPTKRKEHEELKKIPETKSSSLYNKKVEERKNKSNFGMVKKTTAEEEGTAPIDAAPVGDCEKNVSQESQQEENKYATQVADIVKEQIHQFLSTLHDDMNKATRKVRSESPKLKCKNLDIVKQRLQELSKICCLQKDIESHSNIIQFSSLPQPPLPQPPPPAPRSKDISISEFSEECSVIMSDTDFEELKNKSENETIPFKITCYDGGASVSSLISESSDIKTDSDVEINAS